MTSFAIITGVIFLLYQFVPYHCQGFVPGSLRLQGPSSGNGVGRVEVFYKGYWGTICDGGWDMKDAKVACRQLGYQDVARTLPRNEVPSGSGNIWLVAVDCTGEEENITSCYHNGWGAHSCYHSQDAGVECSKTDFSTSPVKIRLQGPLSGKGIGRVEVLYHGYWGTICDYGWDTQDARVVCHQLGYNLDHVHGRTLYKSLVPPGSGQIWLAHVACNGKENNIRSCSHNGWGASGYCSHSNDAGVECSSKAISMRLQGPISASGTGRVEVFYNGHWGTICDNRWDIRDARVVCRELGYRDAARALHGGQVPYGSGQIWLGNIDCNGREQNVTSCHHSGWGVQYCSHHKDAGVECTTTDLPAIPVSLRLQGPLNATGTGRVEVLYNGQWGTICDYGWDLRDARVVCRQLGYQDAVRTLRRYTFPSGSGPIWLAYVACNGDEQKITSCTHSAWKVTYCSHWRDAGVECSTTDFSDKSPAIRLQGPLSANGTGRVEVFYHGHWGTICDYGWDIRDARVVCRQLGYDVDHIYVRGLPRYLVPSGSGQVWLSYVACTGEEHNLTSCSHNGWGAHSCSHYQDAGVECAANDVLVRLQGPSSANGTGRVEVLYNGQWGTICEYGWDLRDARVVCRQLGYLDAARALKGGQVPAGFGKTWLSYVACTGEEKNITNCPNNYWGIYSCSHSSDAGVECSRKDFSTTPELVRLQGLLSANGTGRVEVFYHGHWGTICDYGWDMRDARVVCRQLGYRDAVRSLKREEVPSGSGQIWLSYVACSGEEQNITSCPHYPWGVNYCSHYYDVGVECSLTDFSAVPVPVRLQGPLSGRGTGRVEVFYHGLWGTICDYWWNMKDTRVICRQLGYPDSVRPLKRNQVPSGSGQIWFANVACSGEEQNITSCSYSWYNYCSHWYDVGVECSTTAITVSIKLQGPLSEDGTGRVEIFYNGTWGTICDYGWDLKDARVVCRQLGYKDAARVLRREQVPSGSGKIWLQYVDCTGSERDIGRCSHSGWGVSYCSHSSDAGVECSTTDFSATPVSLRLQGPESENGAGRVEVFYHGYWGTICDYGWDLRDARVVCRQLGYRDAIKTIQRNEVPAGSGQIWLSHVSCTGKENNISSCSHSGWGVRYSWCSHDGDAGLECSPTAITVPIRLQGTSSKKGTGRVEVFYKAEWGTICDSGWDLRDARVVCRQLGYLDAVRTLERNQVPTGSGKIWLTNVACTGEEQNISSCFHSGWDVHSCFHDLDAGVECSTTAITGSLRLQGPLAKDGTGRVEVFYKGQWGTICDYGWDLQDARVVCRQLGYHNAVRTLQRSKIIPGSGQVLLSSVRCTGEEKNITSCFHRGWGVSYSSCSHDRDAGVECSPTERPNVTVNCSRFIAVNVGDDVTCLCEGKGGKPPANVTWYKDGVQIGDIGKEQNVLILSIVDKTDTGTYKCIGKSHILTDETSIEVDFYEKPNVTINCSNPVTVNVGDDVTCLCEGKGFPPADVTWYKNDVQIGDTKKEENVLTLSNITRTDSGTYVCVGKSHSVTDQSSIEVLFNEKLHSKGSKNGTEWYISFIIAVAVIIVVLFIAIVVIYYRRRQLGNRNAEPSPEVQDTNKDPVYEEVDLSNLAPNRYQSAKGAVNDGYSNYSDLDTVRDIGNTYQSLK